MASVYVPIVLGTGRKGRNSGKVARFLESKLLKKGEIKTEIVDVRDHVVSSSTIPAWVESADVAPWRNIAEKADGFVLVAPEYNHSFPGELKLLLDSAFKEYEGKPVAIVGVSTGDYGGVRVIEHMLALVSALKMVPIPNVLATRNVEKLFEEDTPDKEYQAFADSILDQLLAFIHNFKKDI